MTCGKIGSKPGVVLYAGGGGKVKGQNAWGVHDIINHVQTPIVQVKIGQMKQICHLYVHL